MKEAGHSRTELVFSLLYISLHRAKGPLPDQDQSKIAEFSNGDDCLRPVMTQSSSETFSKDFLLIGRNAWLSGSQQISLNRTMKILGTKLIAVCCGLSENLEGFTSSALESDTYNLNSESITALSYDVFNCCCCPKVHSYLKIYK